MGDITWGGREGQPSSRCNLLNVEKYWNYSMERVMTEDEKGVKEREELRQWTKNKKKSKRENEGR